MGIAIDHSGNVYVTDSNNNRIEEFFPDGTFIKAWGIFGVGNGQFNTPYGVAIDGSNNVYVADTGNSIGTSSNRVEVFSPIAAGSPPTSGGGGGCRAYLL